MNDRTRAPAASVLDPDVALQRELPGLVSAVLQTYTAFVHRTAPDDAKEIQQHHMAGKAAVQHLEGLIKLWRSSQPASDGIHLSSHPGANHGADPEHLVQKARRALSQNTGDDA